MEHELIFWSRFNYAVAIFCNDVLSSDSALEGLVNSVGGDELQWCETSTITYLSRQCAESKYKLEVLKKENRSMQQKLRNEEIHSKNLIEKLKMQKRENQDSEWRLQETIASLHAKLVKSSTSGPEKIRPAAVIDLENMESCVFNSAYR